MSEETPVDLNAVRDRKESRERLFSAAESDEAVALAIAIGCKRPFDVGFDGVWLHVGKVDPVRRP